VIHAGASAAGEFGLPAEDCRAQLDRILKSADFEATTREHRFLSHVVEEALAGRGSRIKAYSIAVEVFGRDASFDPQTDPIVRIEAGHLRRSLERYYLTSGQSDPVLITIPKGGYAPTFALRGRPAAAEMALPSIAPASEKPTPQLLWPRPSWLTVVLSAVVAALAVLVFQFQTKRAGPTAPEIPRLVVERFEDLNGSPSSAAIASGLTQEVISQLSKFRDIIVVESVERSPVPPRYVLSGSVSLSDDAFRLQVRLVTRSDGTVLWADSYDGGMKVAEILGAQADIARDVVTSLAQTYGVIYQADTTLDVDQPPDDWAAYSCTLSYYAYRVTLDPKARTGVRTCLEKAVERFPGYATAWGLLAQITLDEVRFRFPYDPVTSEEGIDRALAMARRATELDPRNVRALHAEMSALFWNEDFEAGRQVGEQALALNPNDSEILGGFGTRLALSGSWNDGCALVERARERNLGPFAYYESTLALCSYFSGDYSQAAMWIKKTPTPGNQLYHLIAAAIFGEGGMKSEASQESAWLEKNAPALVKNLRQEMSIRLGRAKDVDFVLGSLKKAGLEFNE
jgi:TolB-like protein